MALSLSGRKLLIEVSGCVAALVVGALVLTHYQQTKQLVAQMFGIRQPATTFGSMSSKLNTDNAPSKVATESVSGRSVELSAPRNGHFFADAEINGRSVNVMVDTGASMVALTYEDARRAGLTPRDSDFTHRANTANGVAKVAPIVIDRLSIGNVEVRNVQAAVMEEGKLDTTLLGMTFLGKLSKFQMQSGKLVLEE